MPSLVAVTVNWRRPDLTERCVSSLRNGSLVPDRIIVVDNGSGDGSVERIRSSCPGVSLLALQENTGFTGGYNAGMREALAGGAGLVFIINNDAEVEQDTMKLLVDA
ncbi:MAG: glycosyltransferase family 2 protein, partial [Lentisphaerae bacterium]|nr:glycosyltransferase family 2 protein [Lentisphaerota bacterium]